MEMCGVGSGIGGVGVVGWCGVTGDLNLKYIFCC
jgi:hypothetical protein